MEFSAKHDTVIFDVSITVWFSYSLTISQLWYLYDRIPWFVIASLRYVILDEKVTIKFIASEYQSDISVVRVHTQVFWRSNRIWAGVSFAQTSKTLSVMRAVCWWFLLYRSEFLKNRKYFRGIRGQSWSTDWSTASSQFLWRHIYWPSMS